MNAGPISPILGEHRSPNSAICLHHLIFLEDIEIRGIVYINHSVFNFGIEAGKPIAEAAIQAGSNELFANNVTFVVILWGGLTTNLIWTTILSLKNKSYIDFTNKNSPIAKNVLFSGLAGTIWYLQFLELIRRHILKGFFRVM